MPLTSTLWSASCEDLSQWRVVPRSKWSSESLPTGKTGSGFHRRDLLQPDLHAHQRTQLVVFISQLYRPKIWILCKQSCCFTRVHSLCNEWITWHRIDFPWAADWLVPFLSLYVALVSPNFKHLGDQQLKSSLPWGIWLEDKRKLYEFVPDLMPYTYVIQNRRDSGNDSQYFGMKTHINKRDITKRWWLMQFEDSNL